jgi:hypothetical protein
MSNQGPPPEEEHNSDAGNRQGPRKRTKTSEWAGQSMQRELPASESIEESAAASDGPLSRVGQGPTSTERVARKDALKREKITHALVQLITRRTNVQPFAIGLFGHWGSGKSSQICFVRTALEGVAAPRIRFAEFNAWEHEGCDNMGAALAQKVVEALVNDLSFVARGKLAARIAMQRKSHLSAALARDKTGVLAWLTKFTHTAAPLLVPAAVAALLAYLLLSRADVGLSTGVGTVGVGAAALWLSTQNFVSKNLTDWFKSINTDGARRLFTLPDFSSKLGTFHEIHTTLKHLCSLHLAGTDTEPGAGDYLFLVVDDLDRCSPHTVKQVFDAVRLVANINRVVTLVALDERIAFSAVEKHFDQFAGSGRDTAQVARDYLGKVFQVAMSLPPVTQQASENFIREKLFEDHIHGAKPATAEPVPMSAETQHAGADFIDVLDDEITLFAELARKTHIANPRQLSRLKQAWFLLRGIVLRDGDEIDVMGPWMSTLFCREWLLQERVETRIALEAAIRGGTRLFVDAESSDSVYALLDDEQGGWQTRWATVDSVLLPARYDFSRSSE